MWIDRRHCLLRSRMYITKLRKILEYWWSWIELLFCSQANGCSRLIHSVHPISLHISYNTERCSHNAANWNYKSHVCCSLTRRRRLSCGRSGTSCWCSSRRRASSSSSSCSRRWWSSTTASATVASGATNVVVCAKDASGERQVRTERLVTSG